jgi:hypothetical protein
MAKLSLEECPKKKVKIKRTIPNQHYNYSECLRKFTECCSFEEYQRESNKTIFLDMYVR